MAEARPARGESSVLGACRRFPADAVRGRVTPDLVVKALVGRRADCEPAGEGRIDGSLALPWLGAAGGASALRHLRLVEPVTFQRGLAPERQGRPRRDGS